MNLSPDAPATATLVAATPTTPPASSTVSEAAIPPSEAGGDVLEISKNFAKTKSSVKPATAVPAATPTVPLAPSAEVPIERDLTGVPAEYHPLLKQMSLPAYQRYKDLEAKIASGEYVAKSDMQKALQDAQLEQHERGFLLSPDYANLQKETVQYEAVSKELEEALFAIEAGQPFTLTMPGANGKEIPQQYQPTPKAKIMLQREYAKISAKQETAAQKMKDLEENHSKRHSERVKGLKDYESKLFSQYEAQPEFGKLAKTLSEQPDIPIEIKNSPLASLFYKQAALNLLMISRLREKSQAANQEAGLAGASPSTITTGSEGGKAADVKSALARNEALLGLAQ